MEFRAVARLGGLRIRRAPRRYGTGWVDAPPYIRVEDNLTWWALGATISIPADQSFELGLSAVIEETDGNKSYWALAHPADAPPDFHDPTCFLAHLPE